MIHVRRLNAIVRWAQLHPMHLTYCNMECAGILEVHSDSGFRREEDETGHASGRALHGANYMRMAKASVGTPSLKRCHLLDWSAKLLKQVTRSTFTSETLGVITAADSAVVLATMMHEVKHGSLPAKEIARLSEEAGLCVRIYLVTDALNLVLALESMPLKMPTEKSFIGHLL